MGFKNTLRYCCLEVDDFVLSLLPFLPKTLKKSNFQQQYGLLNESTQKGQPSGQCAPRK